MRLLIGMSQAIPQDEAQEMHEQLVARLGTDLDITIISGVASMIVLPDPPRSTTIAHPVPADPLIVHR